MDGGQVVERVAQVWVEPDGFVKGLKRRLMVLGLQEEGAKIIVSPSIGGVSNSRS
jgi:hypothetical protein